MAPDNFCSVIFHKIRDEKDYTDQISKAIEIK